MYFRYESTSHNGDGTAISTWLSEQREGQTAVPSFVSFFFFATSLLSLHSLPSALILPWGNMIWEVVKFFFPYWFKNSLAFCCLQFSITPLDLWLPAKNEAWECIIFFEACQMTVKSCVLRLFPQDARFDNHLTGFKKESFHWRTKTIAHNKGFPRK